MDNMKQSLKEQLDKAASELNADRYRARLINSFTSRYVARIISQCAWRASECLTTSLKYPQKVVPRTIHIIDESTTPEVLRRLRKQKRTQDLLHAGYKSNFTRMRVTIGTCRKGTFDPIVAKPVMSDCPITVTGTYNNRMKGYRGAGRGQQTEQIFPTRLDLPLDERGKPLYSERLVTVKDAPFKHGIQNGSILGTYKKYSVPSSYDVVARKRKVQE